MTRSAYGRSLINFYHGPALLVRVQRSVTKVIARINGQRAANAALLKAPIKSMIYTHQPRFTFI
jgi:hypothetical protein